MADFGLYQGLMRKSNIFETKAQNRQMEMQIASVMEQRSKEKLVAEQEVSAKVQEFYDTVNQLDILEQDKERVNSAEKRLRSDVIQGIKQYNGDLEKFMLAGGTGTLAAYRNNLLESQEVRGAIENKTNYAQWAHAQANGLWVNDVAVDVNVLNPDGTETSERKKVSMNEAWKMYENGQIATLPWDGAEQDIDVGPEFFQKLYKDPRNPYSQDTEVAAEDVYTWVRQHGGSDAQAKKKMEKYVQYRDQGGTPWRYQSGDIMKLKLQQAELRNSNQRYQMNKQAMQEQLPRTNILDMESRIKNAAKGEDVKILPEEMNFYANQFGFVYDETTGVYKTTRDIPAFDRQTKDNKNPKEYSLRNFSSFYPEGYTIGENGEVMLKMRATYADNGGDDLIPMYEDWLGFGKANEGVDLNNWQRRGADQWGGDNYEGNVYIPITDYFTGDYESTYLNKKIGVTGAADFHPNRVGNDERFQNSANVLNNFFNTMSGVIGSTVTPEQAAEYGFNYVTDDGTNGGEGGAMEHLNSQK